MSTPNKTIKPMPAAARAETLRLWNALAIRPEKVAMVEVAIVRLLGNRRAYERLDAATGVPWWLIGCIHYREGNFSGHLHNGDPLSARTRNVPAGRPLAGSPPFSFHDSAIDALAYDGLTTWRDYTIAGALWAAESLNGFGYRNLASPMPSPYLWSFSAAQPPGKFVRDHVIDRNAVDAQAGVAVILKRMEQLGFIRFKPAATPAAPVWIVRQWNALCEGVASLFAANKGGAQK